MRRVIVIIIMLLGGAPAFAQSKAIMNGVDTREWPLRVHHLSAMVGELSQSLAELQSKMDVMQADQIEMTKNLNDSASQLRWWQDCAKTWSCAVWATGGPTSNSSQDGVK